jgi:CheY-like chemotaxis protein
MIFLYADDNRGDQLLVQEALWEAGVACDLRFVSDGEELLDYLYQLGKYSKASAPRPDIILLDLNMPRKSGIEALLDIKSNPFFWGIPIIVLSSSNADVDVVRAYEAGATAYTHKPTTFPRLVRMMEALGRWWETVQLPQVANDCFARDQFVPTDEDLERSRLLRKMRGNHPSPDSVHRRTVQ